MRYFRILLLCILATSACSSDGSDSNSEPEKYTRFSGNYNKTFNDMPDLHTEAATANGIDPLENRADTASHTDDLVRIPQELDIYRVDKLTHSIPYLVPKAATLLTDICLNFRDSLISKGLPLYKPVVTSILRTGDDVKGLSKRNRNASSNSVHIYGTTFDMAWTRFDKVNAWEKKSLDDGRLKAVLGQVLHDLRERDRCYVKHERKQSCFHITVR